MEALAVILFVLALLVCLAALSTGDGAVIFGGIIVALALFLGGNAAASAIHSVSPRAPTHMEQSHHPHVNDDPLMYD